MEQDKEVAPEPSNELWFAEEEEADVEVNLPLGTSLLHNKELTIRLIRQLFRDVDMALVSDGWIQDHLDEFL